MVNRVSFLLPRKTNINEVKIGEFEKVKTEVTELDSYGRERKERTIGYLIIDEEEREAWIVGKIPPETELSDLYKEFPGEIDLTTFWEVKSEIRNEKEVEDIKYWHLTGELERVEKPREEKVGELKEILREKFMRNNIENY